MSLSDAIKIALKRGALVTAANWEIVVIQFVADSAFKALLTVPILGAAFLIALIVGSTVPDVIASDLRSTVVLALAALSEHRAALAAFLLGVVVVIVGGSVLMFLVKSGSVAVLVDAERHAPVIEQPPLRSDVVREGSRFTLEAFSEGCTIFGRRFVPRDRGFSIGRPRLELPSVRRDPLAGLEDHVLGRPGRRRFAAPALPRSRPHNRKDCPSWPSPSIERVCRNSPIRFS